ncbi:YybH family protein [Pararhodonellum marinum]|uniref:YybH family protein n=1 Tax=Pararhodonellum marinum TaxID=2755358 RepID=UPI00188F1976|nr:SgcJ/EcaC family oxidoreductase [Pararhodonellum marinum]
MDNSTAKNPQEIPQLFVAAWNAKNAKSLAELFEENAEFINVTGLWWHDRASIQKAHQYGFEKIFKLSSLQLIRTKLTILNEDLAIVHARMKLEGQTSTKEVPKPGVRKNIFTFVVRKQKITGNWLVVASQNTDIIPNMETLVNDQAGSLIPTDYSKEAGN